MGQAATAPYAVRSCGVPPLNLLRRHPRTDTTTRTTLVDGYAIADRVCGSGAPIVFVHGLAVSSRYFVPTMRVLADRYTCRAVDLPGFGRSDKPQQVLSVTGLAAALAAWLRVNDLVGAPLVGNSAGCQYIAGCVARHADVTGPVVLIGPTTDAAARTAWQQVGRWLRTGRYADITQLPVVAQDCREAGLARVAATFRSVLDDAIESKLPGVAQPTLVIRGSQDPLVPRPWAQEVVRLLPRSRLVEIPGGAHVVNFTRPQDVARAIDEFLRDPSGGTA